MSLWDLYGRATLSVSNSRFIGVLALLSGHVAKWSQRSLHPKDHRVPVLPWHDGCCAVLRVCPGGLYFPPYPHHFLCIQAHAARSGQQHGTQLLPSVVPRRVFRYRPAVYRRALGLALPCQVPGIWDQFCPLPFMSLVQDSGGPDGLQVHTAWEEYYDLVWAKAAESQCAHGNCCSGSNFSCGSTLCWILTPVK